MGVSIQGYPNYIIEKDGRIFSLYSNKYLKPAYTGRGYFTVELFNNKKSKRFLVHRLVAQAYIPNPNNLPQINHKDENPSNNHMDNLEWCDAKYNMNYGNGAKTRHSKIDYSKPIYRMNAIKNGKKVCKALLMFSKDGKFIQEFVSGAEAERKTGIDARYISLCANGKRKTSGGFIFKFKERKGE